MCSGMILAGTSERHADVDQGMSMAWPAFHAGDCREGDQSKHQSIFDQVLTFFPHDQAPHPREHPQFEPPLRSFLYDLPVPFALAKESMPGMAGSPGKEGCVPA